MSTRYQLDINAPLKQNSIRGAEELRAMDAQRIRSLLLWYNREEECGVDECDVFITAYEWKYGEIPPGRRLDILGEDIEEFEVSNKVPQYVEEYLQGVIFPKMNKVKNE